MLAGAAVCLALCGLALTLGSGFFRLSGEVAGRLCFLGAALCFLLTALLRPRPGRLPAVESESRFRPAASTGCTFADVAANDEARRSLAGLADYLKHPEKYASLGARMPKGVLLYGPPGTGKTLLARALAGEAGVPFFALSGSDFVEMYVGVGAKRVRELFRGARKAGKCVIFIDEIDALGRRRDQVASDERDQTLNALLNEMSGFRPGGGVIVLAATNRLEALDPALLRPGRFDRQIEVGLPDRAERLQILRLHGRNKPLADEVDLEALAADTTAFSGASLENLLNEAAILAAARGAREIRDADIKRAFYQAVAGADRPNRASPEERRQIAVHEAGHALAAHLLMPENRLRRVSILPAGHGAAGYSLTIPCERVLLSRRDIERQIQVLLAGRAAELLTGDAAQVSSGAASDLSRAAELASAMVMELGMDEHPAFALRTLNERCGGPSAAVERCKDILAALYDGTQRLLTEHRAELQRLADRLAEAESLSGEEVLALLQGAA